MSKYFTLLFAVLVSSCAGQSDIGERVADRTSDDRVILITLDGLRWKELFTGADPYLIASEEFTHDPDRLKSNYWAETPEERRELLMPFFWTVIRNEGVLLGNRTEGSMVDVTNHRVFSYPGYNEILTGSADDSIDSNDKIPNRNVSVLEWVNQQPGFEGEVAAFGSWDALPYIINEERAGILVNGGYESMSDSTADPSMAGRLGVLNALQKEIPHRWRSVRFDGFTHHFATEYLKHRRPRLLYIAYGETDNFAHDGEYEAYLNSAHQTDEFIREIWEWVQQDPEYRSHTTMIIATDHGRGDRDRWIGHGIDWKGSSSIWAAMIGSHVKADSSDQARGQFYQNQLASTVARALGLDYEISFDGRNDSHIPGSALSVVSK